MDSDENKRLITAMLSGEANLVDVLSDDATWVVPGFKSFRGKQEILEQFFGPIGALMESMGRVVPTNVIAEGDQVVVEGTQKIGPASKVVLAPPESAKPYL